MLLFHTRNNELYPIQFTSLQPRDVKKQMADWEKAFDWTIYFGQPYVEAYKLTVTGNNAIQGALAIERKEDHVYIHLIESAPHNRLGKEFDWVGEHLIAFACQRSKDLGLDGFVSFQSENKARLINHYMRNIGAKHIGGGLMIISESVAENLIMLYLS